MISSISIRQPVLNPGQLRRIEAIHRGWLYQHLFAVACLLRRTRDLTAVVVERDEDVELILPEGRIYIQVKTRADAVELSDVETTLSRFEDIRSAHTNGDRPGFCEFWIVSNVGLSATLLYTLEIAEYYRVFSGGSHCRHAKPIAGAMGDYRGSVSGVRRGGSRSSPRQPSTPNVGLEARCDNRRSLRRY